MGQLNAGVKKQVLKNKGTLKLNVRDILYSMQANGGNQLSTHGSHLPTAKRFQSGYA